LGRLAEWNSSPEIAGMKTIAVLGASTDRSKFGNKAVRAYLQRGFTVYPVNPNETVVEGLVAYRNVSELPMRPDIVSVYVPPQVLERCLTEIAAKGCDELWLNPGTETGTVLTEAARLSLNVVQGCSILRVGVSPATV
jgi:predicted CoA-binding protein